MMTTGTAPPHSVTGHWTQPVPAVADPLPGAARVSPE
jgi:hypothetical protein